ncbi:hypothetical protein A1O3_00207 [Capronia epimyces CBS 606.96]|uniref:Phospholipase/carboxylesterase/thioesterase domain-containing protein n=1 Tax=Capronia epimyces CBS 606.96 TaxID=1182542 RepID=W9YFJ5_9EURO|nr:uncharacterized protein A1O3_00207 [Capronia epimyces CBS 606.96]EXJ91657.1 hypothetical protein A1O3_00207 [Capronia epimyces CBS 606.96]
MSSNPSIPLASDFPASLEPIIHLPANNRSTNVVLFLPGLGDTVANFSSFARALNLPDVLTITLKPPFPLPFPLGPGDQWSEDLQVDASTGALDPDSPLTRAIGLVAKDVIANVLVGKLKYRPDHVHLIGFGQGGSVAVSVPLHSSLASLPPLGSVISIGGVPPITTSLASSTSRNRTPVLLLSGSKSPLASADSSPLKRVKLAYNFVTYHQWKKTDDSMPKNRDEVLPMMQFWARRLKSRRGVPDDAVEIS